MSACLNMGGPAVPTPVANVEQYNGTSWTEIADLNQGRENAMSSSSGPTTATLFIGGSYSPGALTEQFNGTSWTEVADLNESGGQGCGVGTEAAALIFGGAYNDRCETWNGTSWTVASALNEDKGNVAGFGFQTAASAVGGRNPTSSPAILSNVEAWDGSSWSETTNLNTGKSESGSTGNSPTSGLVYGGAAAPGDTATTEYWNGSSWTEVGDLANAGSRISCYIGTASTAAIVPYQTSPSLTTEEWNAPIANQTVTVS